MFIHGKLDTDLVQLASCDIFLPALVQPQQCQHRNSFVEIPDKMKTNTMQGNVKEQYLIK